MRWLNDWYWMVRDEPLTFAFLALLSVCYVRSMRLFDALEQQEQEHDRQEQQRALEEKWRP